MIARTDDYNSTINFPSRKILFLSFFDRPRSTLFLVFFPLLLSHCLAEKFIPSSHRLLVASVFPVVRRKEKKFLRSIVVPRIDSSLSVLCFSYYFQPFKKKKKKGEEKKRKGSKTTSRCGQCFVRISLLFYSFIPREITLIISHRFLEWLLEEM